MSETTKIQWADATFNPWIGCTRVGPGCDNCYAAVSTPSRSMSIKWGAGEPRHHTSSSNWAQPLVWERKAQAFHAEHGRRQRVFCASLADVFDNEVQPAWRTELFALIASTPHLDWMLLTKRIGNVAKMIDAPGMQKCGLPENVWLGATVVNQEEADRDIPKLLAVPARVRFLSVEPMLGPVDVRWAFADAGVIRCPKCMFGTNILDHGPCPNDGETLRNDPGIDWVICGGESGPGARPMHPDWARSLRHQCAAAGVPFLFKQWGEYAEARLSNVDASRGNRFVEMDGTDSTGWTIDKHVNGSAMMVRIGKKAAGRLLDGVEHNGFPTPNEHA